MKLGIDDRSKFWYLIVSIKYGTLNSVNNKIFSSIPYRQEFDASVTLYKGYINQSQDTNVELNISGVGTGSCGSSGEETFTGDI